MHHVQQRQAFETNQKIGYLIVDAKTSYYILLGRSSRNLLREIVSTPHLAMKFLSASGDIGTVHVS